jgi:hypothetical protein
MKTNFLIVVFLIAGIQVFNSCSKQEKKDVNQQSNTQNRLKAACADASIHYGEYWLNNNKWGSSNPGFGSQCVWLTNQNSWGANCTHTGSYSSGIKGYPSMVFGKQGSVSTTTQLPKSISSLGNVHTWWAWSATGSSWDAAYDVWFNGTAYELMIWGKWNNAWPIGNSLGAVATNVNLSGYTWNVYKKGTVISFLLVNQQWSLSFDMKPIINYCVSKGWIPSSASLTCICAGWEVINGGTYSTNSFGISQI